MIEDDYVITIPTKGRPEIIKNRTLSFFEKSKKIYIVIEPQDKELYDEFKDDYSIIILPKNNRGLTFARNYIQKYFKDKYRYVWQVDDNIDQFIMRNGLTDGGHPRLRPIEEQNITAEQIFDETFEIMKESEYIQMTLSFRPSNWLYPEGEIKEYVRAWGIVFNDNKKMIENDIYYDLNCKLFQDLELVARIFKEGFTNASFYRYAFHKKMAHYDGGCQTYRDLELSNKICNYIKKKYRGYVKIKYNERHKLMEPKFKWSSLQNYKNHQNTNLMKFIKSCD